MGDTRKTQENATGADFPGKDVNTQENRTTVLLSYEERVEREENIKDVIRETCRKALQPQG